MEKLKLLESNPTALASELSHPIFKIISETAKELQVPAFAIGGFVRDLILERPCTDIDIVTRGKGIELAEKVAEKVGITQISVFKNFGTAMFHYQGMDVEFVGARKESYNRDSRKPVVEDGSLEDDQNRRDFTINAMALSLQPSSYGILIDPFDGIKDLQNKVLRTPLEPDITFSDDPLRMMRAIRFANQLNFTIDPICLKAIQDNKDRITIVSEERITTELNKIILTDKPSVGFNLLDRTGLLEIIFPEFSALKGVEIINGKGHKDNFYHTLEVLENICENSSDLWLRWAAIMHDIAKPPTKKFHQKVGWTFHGHEFVGSKMVPKIFRRMKLPLDHQMKFVQKLVLLHLRPIALTKDIVTDSAIRRLLFDAGDDIESLMMLCKADITSKNEAKVRRYLANFEKVIDKMHQVEQNDSLRNWQPPIDGNEIMQTFNLGKCREIGLIKDAIRNAILDGELENDKEKALEFMLKKGKELGLQKV